MTPGKKKKPGRGDPLSRTRDDSADSRANRTPAADTRPADTRADAPEPSTPGDPEAIAQARPRLRAPEPRFSPANGAR